MKDARKSFGGFTLVELLVAAAITVILAALMLTVTVRTLEVWRGAQGRFTTDAQGQLVLDLIERDFQAAIFRDDGHTWLAAEVINAPGALSSHGWLTHGRVKPAGGESRRYVPMAAESEAPRIADARFGFSGVWLRFFTTNVEAKGSSNSGGSLPVAVSYQIVRRPASGAVSASNPAAVRYSLFRSVVTNELTWRTGFDVLAAGYGSLSSNPAATRSARSLTNPNAADVIATNVVDFGVWLHRRQVSGELIRIYPANDADAMHAAVTSGEFPDVVDVMVRVLTEEGASLLETLERGGDEVVRPAELADDAAWWWAIVEKHSRVHVRRIAIKADAR